MFDNQIVSAIASLVVGALSTWGAIALKKTWEPKDRMQTVFDGYEKLIQQQQESTNWLREQLDESQELIQRLKQELVTVQKRNVELEGQLKTIREEYGKN